jgi:hypothetical protein
MSAEAPTKAESEEQIVKRRAAMSTAVLAGILVAVLWVLVGL